RLVEEHLVELDLAADVTQRTHVDPGRVHVDEEVGDALVLGPARIGTREEDGEVGVLRPRGPHLLTGDHPLVAVTHRLRGQPRDGHVGLDPRLGPSHALVDGRRRIDVQALTAHRHTVRVGTGRPPKRRRYTPRESGRRPARTAFAPVTSRGTMSTRTLRGAAA